MQLHTLNSIQSKTKRRIGRGGKRGTYSGRGQKGQKSRAGRVIRPAQRDLILRLPKRRGFKNKPLSPRPVAVNLGDLKDMSGVVSRKTLVESGIIKLGRGQELKILSNGELSKPLVFEGLKVSERAKMKIEKAGGKVQ